MFERLKNRAEELAEPQARSADARHGFQVRSAGVDTHRPPKRQMDDHWELFEQVSIVRESIRAFAGEVVSDGYYIETDSKEAREDLEEWLKDCAIVNADVDNDFRKIVEEAIVQQEVRGTSLVEIVRDDEDNLYGFKSIRPQTVKQYTLPGQAVLLAPDQNLAEADIDEDDIVRTENGEVAAYVQYDDELKGYRDKDPIGFTRDEVLKFTRDGDVGSPWGTSRLDAVKDRIESLLNKLDNNDQAIESLAWKYWLFKFGSEENPWPEDKIDEFMSNHSAEEFQPGEKHGAQGDIDIQTVNGEVADIEEYLGFDIDWIVAALPYPKYGLGGFEENVNQFVSRSQEARVKNQIQEARRRYSEGFTDVIKDKAEEMGYSREDVELVIGLSPEERAIRMDTTIGDRPYYPSGGVDAANDGFDSGGTDGSGGTDYTRPPASTETPDGPEPTRPEMRGAQNSVWDVDVGSVEELASQFTDLDEERDQLMDVGTDTLLSVRDEVLNSIERHFKGSLSGVRSGRVHHPREYRKPAERAVRNAMAKSAVQRRSESPFTEALEATYDSLEDEGVLEPGFSTRRRNLTDPRRFSDNFDVAIRDAAEEMARDISHTVRAGLERGEEFATVRERVTTEFNRNSVRQTSMVVSQMELKNSVETTRLREYEMADDVIGVRPVADCRETSTPLCRHLTGCEGNQAIAYFEDGSIGEQLQEQVADDLLLRGFDPLPESPPFHYMCMTELEAVTAEEAELGGE